MKKIKIEIQITLLSIFIAAAVIGSGYLVYHSFSKIVDSIHKEARPDLKLLLIKDIASNLNEVENTIRLYSLTLDESLIYPYRRLNETIQGKLNDLEDYAIPGSNEVQLIDSIRLLTNRKLIIWAELRALQKQKEKSQISFSELYSKIDTAIILPDTIVVQQPIKQKGFFRRLLSKKDTTTTPPIIIDKSEEKEQIKQEIAEIEQQASDQSQQLLAREKVLVERSIQVTNQINLLISQLETREQQRLRNKTEEADFMAAQTYRLLTVFTIAAVFLLIVVLVLFFRHLRHSRAYQQMLQRARTEAENLSKAKEMFVATVSHEMRTPVNAIYGLTEQMLKKTHSNEVTTDLEIVYKSAQHLISLVNDTLDFSKIESQKLKLQQHDFYLNEVTSEVYALLKDTAEEKGLSLIISNELPRSRVLKGDPIRLKQILINLLNNAIKFTEQGQVSLSISEERTLKDSYILHLKIADTGIGISKENLSRIFDEFVQLDGGLTQKHRGAGLGLAIVKKLVDLHSGKIKVESIPGKGTRFILQIPYQEGNPDFVARKEDRQFTIPQSWKNLRVLLVDDEEFNRYLLKNILNKWGIPHEEASDGKQALQLATQQVFNLILMDMRMPVMDGLEASKQILNVLPETEIIALTATNRKEDVQRCRQVGIRGFLQKPFSEAELYQAFSQRIPSGEVKTKPESEHPAPQIDLEELKNMAEGDETFFKEMIEIFISSSEKGMVTIRRCFDKSDWNGIAEAAHKLAAPAKHMQATQLYEFLKNLESHAGKGKNQEEIKRLIELIEQKIIPINQYLKERMTGK
ncbi:hybrid sensor histidine kinase/response regulator [Gaoshiqia sp. Z1-71]|uniref:hybrid sensor histidine kinase/response regulator n=1 Tax=Gaoshiqia hydrogeniformans TaxID=3290090 RepID=UPI003BF8E2DB